MEAKCLYSSRDKSITPVTVPYLKFDENGTKSFSGIVMTTRYKETINYVSYFGYWFKTLLV